MARASLSLLCLCLSCSCYCIRCDAGSTKRDSCTWNLQLFSSFLTGAHGDMDAIRRKLGFFDRDPQVDGNLSQQTGMIRIGNEAYDRWSMMPALLTPRQLANSIVRL